MVKKKIQPGWLSIKRNPGKLKPMSTRNIVKRHLKEWNKDDKYTDTYEFPDGTTLVLPSRAEEKRHFEMMESLKGED